MLSSIHPLGEGGRNNRWGVTVTAFSLASVVAGAVVGGSLGLVGTWLLPGPSEEYWLVAIAVVAIGAGILDLARVNAPGPARQVNEAWIGRYRNWIYGGAFGAQLGVGFSTYVVTWGVYSTLAVEFLSASPTRGMWIGGIFGAGRTIGLFVALRVDRPSRLANLHRNMAKLGRPIHLATAAAAILIGVFAGFEVVL